MTDPILKILDAIRDRCDKATKGPLLGNHTLPVAEVKDLVIAGLIGSIESSIAHDGGHPFCWVETEDGRKVCITGCGPQSADNMRFFGHSRTDLDRTEKALREACKALDRIERHSADDEPGGGEAVDALARIQAILEGEE